MALDNETIQVYGAVGVSQPINTDVCVIPTPGKGRWKVWGHGRHSDGDGLKVIIGLDTIQLSAVSWTAIHFGPIIADVTTNQDNIAVQLAIATAADGSASCTVYAQKIYP